MFHRRIVIMNLQITHKSKTKKNYTSYFKRCNRMASCECCIEIKKRGAEEDQGIVDGGRELYY